MPESTARSSQLAQSDKVDPIWGNILSDAQRALEIEPVLGSLLHTCVIAQDSLEAAVAHRVSERLDHGDVSADAIRQAFAQMIASDASFSRAVRVDLQAVFDRDPACSRYLEPLLYFKGFHAIQSHRLAHWLYKQGRKDFALYLQSRASMVFQTDINPAAPFGVGIFLDHATGFVVGETASVGDNVSILHGVTLGGTGKEGSDRHPKIGDDVLIGAGAKILGNIRIGHCSKVAAGSVVLNDVPPKKTVAGVPAKIVGEAGCSQPSRAMNQLL
ncbi:MAG: serine O-acetyltransferase [Pseudomonadota bacterium]